MILQQSFDLLYEQHFKHKSRERNNQIIGLDEVMLIFLHTFHHDIREQLYFINAIIQFHDELQDMKESK